MVALVYGLVHAAEESWLHAGTTVPLAAGVLLAGLFVWAERRAGQPILPLRLFASRQRSGANGARVLFVGACMGFFFYCTQYLQGVLGMRPLWAGIAFFPSMLVNLLGALAGPRLVRRWGAPVVLPRAMFVSLIGMAWLGQVQAGSASVLDVVLPMMLVGAGMGASLALLTISGVAGVPPRDAGSASGLVGVAHQLGGALGLAVLVVAFSGSSVPAAAPTAVEPVHRIDMALFAGAVMLALALFLVLAFVVPRAAMPQAAAHSPSH